MKILRLYESMPEAAIEKVAPLERDEQCRRCKLGDRSGVRSRCLPADGEPGGLLVVGEAPGREEDECLVPETLVLMSDFRWKVLGDVEVGDEVLGVEDEAGPGSGASGWSARRWRIGKVTRKVVRQDVETWRVHTALGDLIGSGDHRVLAHKGASVRWMRIDQMMSVDCGRRTKPNVSGRASHLSSIGGTWEQVRSFDAGWLAGFFDGEGHITGSRGGTRKKAGIAGFTQNLGRTHADALERLTAFGFNLRSAEMRRSKGVICSHEHLRGGVLETIRFLMEIRPERLIRDFLGVLERKHIRCLAQATVLSRGHSGRREVVDITTTCGTFIANGFVVHNCGRPFVGASGKMLRKVLAEHWKGPVAIANAVGCYPGKRKLTDGHVRACRPYLADVLRLVQPDRIVLLGAQAAHSVLGRSIAPFSSRGAYAFLSDGTPVFTVVHPAAALRNRFVRGWFVRDLARALVASPELPPLRAEVRVVQNSGDADEAIEDLSSHDAVAFDVETAGAMWRDMRLLCVSFAPVGAKPERAYTFGFGALANPGAFVKLRKFLRDSPNLGGQNDKFDRLVVLQTLAVRMRPSRFDVRLQRKLIDAEAKADLEHMVELVGMGGMKEDAQRRLAELTLAARKAVTAHDGPVPPPLKTKAAQAKREAQRAELLRAYKLLDPFVVQCIHRGYVPEQYGYLMLQQHDEDTLHRYNARDSVGTARLASRFWEELKQERNAPLLATWKRTVLPASGAIARVEENGVCISRAAVEAFDADMGCRERDLLEKLRKHADINWGSNTQIAELLYGKLGLPCAKATKGGGESTDEEALEPLKKKHPCVSLLLDLRSVTKLRGTYAQGLLRGMRENDRVHCNYKLDGTRTGRPSATEPNLLNIPRAGEPPGGTPEGKAIRDCFIASPGKFLVELDESQVELRMAAALSGDPLMIDIFRKGEDYHLRTAQLVAKDAWGLKPEQVGKKERQHCKTTNFAVLYGSGAAGIAKQLGISKAVAARLMDAIFGRFTRLADYREEMLLYAQKHGHVWTSWGDERARRRPLWRVADSDDATRIVAEHGSLNCLDGETEALTKRGWVKGFELLREDELLTKNSVSGVLEWQHMTDLRLWPNHEGPIVEFKSRSFHAVSTLEHRWLVRNKSSGRDEECTTRKLSLWGDHRIHRTGNYEPKIKSALTPDEAELLGWFVTDGTLQRTAHRAHGHSNMGPKAKAGGFRAILCQSSVGNPEKCARIDALLLRIAAPGEITCSQDRKGGERFWRLGSRLTILLRSFCPDRTLTIRALLDLDRPALERLREAMLLGDGTRGSKHVLCTGRREQAEAFQVLCTLTGSAASIIWRDMSKYRPMSKKLNNVPKMTGIWLVTVLRRDTAQVVHRQRREYTAKVPVWCPIVPNTFFIARRSGHVFVTGNTPVQGSANDICLQSLVALDDWIVRNGLAERIKLVLTVYDSIMAEVDEELIDEFVEVGQHIMTSWPVPNDVPLAVDVKTGKSWGSMTSYKA